MLINALKMTSTYCNVDFNWYSPKSQSFIRYSFIDLDSSDFEGTSYEDRTSCNEELCKVFYKKDKKENFTLSIICVNPLNSQINGLSVDSESRTVEISNEADGYIKTVRGKRITSDSGKEFDAGDKTFYVCSSSFEKSYSSLSIKFLSLGQKESISLRSLRINLQQHDLGSQGTSMGETFDMVKLRKEVESMGDSVSDKALDFLKTMEIFEQNKIKSMETFSGLDALKGKQSETSSCSTSLGNGMMSLGIPAIMRSVLGEETMSHLQEGISKNGEETEGQNDSIYSMLQAVCGKVAKTRKLAEGNEDTPSSATDLDKEQMEAEEHPVNGKSKVSSVLYDIFDQRLNEAKQDMRAEIHSVKEEVMSQMNGIKKELSEKLDGINALLQKLVDAQNSTEEK